MALMFTLSPLISPSIFTLALVKAIISQTSTKELSFTLVAVALTLTSPIASILASSPISTVASTVLVMVSTPQSSVSAFLLVELAVSATLPVPVAPFTSATSPLLSTMDNILPSLSLTKESLSVVFTVAFSKASVLTTLLNTTPVCSRAAPLLPFSRAIRAARKSIPVIALI